MAKDTFSEAWLPNIAHNLARKPDVNQIKFGDNYEVRVATGLNNQPEVWTLTFTYNYAKLLQLDAFLIAQGGVNSFFWRTPHNKTITCVCREWSIANDEGIKTLSAKFEQVFEV